ncbi:hypothetical protein ACPWSR_13360 [Alloiococcus sp. CFN-8]|uniref:hypothetical protein n=1 Tax=Alloiococcus sp. CFN-8 TaxID=3416081 RepID=UPI003CF1918B
MNEKKLDVILSNYKASFKELNSEPNGEYYKWYTVEHFDKNWDIDAEDFSAMFREATVKAHRLINNKVVEPLNGILELSKHNSHKVREMFKRLYNENESSAKGIQGKVNDFINEANKTLESLDSGKWKYSQHVGAVVLYLAIFNPSENYFFKATEARTFAEYIEYDREITTGNFFNLKNYYAMCDILVEAIKEDKELLELHETRWAYNNEENGRKPDIKDDYHILAYDIIYCAHNYKLYKSKPQKVKVKKTGTKKSISSKKKEMQEKEKGIIDRLSIDISNVNEKIRELEDKEEKVVIPRLEGMKVIHKSFKEGTVISQFENYLIISFPEGEKKFAIPNSFASGFLSLEDENLMKEFLATYEITKEKELLKEELKQLSLEILKHERILDN